MQSALKNNLLVGMCVCVCVGPCVYNVLLRPSSNVPDCVNLVIEALEVLVERAFARLFSVYCPSGSFSFPLTLPHSRHTDSPSKTNFLPGVKPTRTGVKQVRNMTARKFPGLSQGKGRGPWRGVRVGK